MAGEDMTRALQVAFTVMAGLLVVAMVAMWRAGDSASAQDLLGPGMSTATKKQADKQRVREAEEAEAAKAAAAGAGHGGGHEAGKRTEKPKPQVGLPSHANRIHLQAPFPFLEPPKHTEIWCIFECAASDVCTVL